MFRVRITGKRISYDIDLKSRYVVVIGDSGAGKSFFVNLLMNRKKEPGYKFELIGEKRAVVTPGDALHDLCGFKAYEKNAYLLIADDKDYEFDEDVKLFLDHAIDTVFMIITRNEFIPDLNYGLADIYVFDCVQKTNILLPAFTYCSNLEGNSPLPASVGLLTEDTKAGRQFYEHLFERKALQFPGGKDYIIDWLYENADTLQGGVILFADWCSFGSHVIELNSFLSKTKCSPILLLLDARSFEYVILSSRFFDASEWELDLSVKHEETFYEQRLVELTDGTPLKLAHGKQEDLSVCYYEECCGVLSRSNNVNRDDCRRGLSGEDKFVAMFIGTDLEALLRLAGRI